MYELSHFPNILCLHYNSISFRDMSFKFHDWIKLKIDFLFFITFNWGMNKKKKNKNTHTKKIMLCIIHVK